MSQAKKKSSCLQTSIMTFFNKSQDRNKVEDAGLKSSDVFPTFDLTGDDDEDGDVFETVPDARKSSAAKPEYDIDNIFPDCTLEPNVGGALVDAAGGAVGSAVGGAAGGGEEFGPDATWVQDLFNDEDSPVNSQPRSKRLPDLTNRENKFWGEKGEPKKEAGSSSRPKAKGSREAGRKLSTGGTKENANPKKAKKKTSKTPKKKKFVFDDDDYDDFTDDSFAPRRPSGGSHKVKRRSKEQQQNLPDHEENSMEDDDYVDLSQDIADYAGPPIKDDVMTIVMRGGLEDTEASTEAIEASRLLLAEDTADLSPVKRAAIRYGSPVHTPPSDSFLMTCPQTCVWTDQEDEQDDDSATVQPHNSEFIEPSPVKPVFRPPIRRPSFLPDRKSSKHKSSMGVASTAASSSSSAKASGKKKFEVPVKKSLDLGNNVDRTPVDHVPEDRKSVDRKNVDHKNVDHMNVDHKNVDRKSIDRKSVGPAPGGPQDNNCELRQTVSRATEIVARVRRNRAFVKHNDRLTEEDVHKLKTFLDELTPVLVDVFILVPFSHVSGLPPDILADQEGLRSCAASIKDKMRCFESKQAVETSKQAVETSKSSMEMSKPELMYLDCDIPSPDMSYFLTDEENHQQSVSPPPSPVFHSSQRRSQPHQEPVSQPSNTHQEPV